ncbi:rev protein [Simian immunodeficiency virus - agm.sab-1]|uniref:Protein Rev n=1 Tax=Simian immunodeficiency virus - agm.sab-1 TaxID=349974 RepID=Q87112_SIVSA|nr:rev protein - simian immunodeficiency virus SIVagm (isolate SAB-1) [Simian immunodeficiency virus - agm]AAA21508.1 rev protein [Simian immunodeficiency virus - agm.sab-1]
MSLGQEELLRRFRIIKFLYTTNPYPPGQGTARQRRRARQRWAKQRQQVIHLAERILETPVSQIDHLAQEFDQLVLDNLQQPPSLPPGHPTENQTANSSS